MSGYHPRLPKLPFDALDVGAKVVPTATLSGIQQCRVLMSTVKHGWLALYVDIIVFESGS